MASVGLFAVAMVSQLLRCSGLVLLSQPQQSPSAGSLLSAEKPHQILAKSHHHHHHHSNSSHSLAPQCITTPEKDGAPKCSTNTLFNVIKNLSPECQQMLIKANNGIWSTSSRTAECACYMAYPFENFRKWTGEDPYSCGPFDGLSFGKEREYCAKRFECEVRRDSVTHGQVGLTGLDEDLAYLSGSMHHSNGFAEGSFAVGWFTGTTVAVGGNDHMTVFRKGRTCAVAFSATDDDTDTFQQFIGVIMPKEMCGFSGVNGGYVDELTAFMDQNSTFPLAMQELKEECDDIYATGASMGGAIASLFAACANKGAAGLDLGVKLKLVTFGAPAASQTRLYSGREGGVFEGTRYTVASTWEKAPQDFYLDNLKVAAVLLTRYGMTEKAKEFDDFRQTLNNDKDTPAFWEKLEAVMGEEDIKDVYVTMIMGALDKDALLVANTKKWRDSLFTYYDGTSSMWAPWGFDHPLMEVAYLSNPNGGPPPPSTWGVTPAPSYAYTTYFSAILANNMWHPNHAICCYIGGKDSLLNPGDACSAKYTEPLWNDCAVPFTRLPASSA